MSPSPTALVISPEYPYPADSGSKIAIASSLALLHEAGWRIVLVVVTSYEQDPALRTRVPSPFPLDVHVLSRLTRFTTRIEPELDYAVQSLIDQERPVLIWTEYAQYAPLLREVETRGAVVWFRSINFELMHRWEKTVSSFPVTVRKGRAALRQWREDARLLWVAYQWERRMHQVADRIWHISYREASLLPRLYRGKQPAQWLPPILEREPVSIQPHEGPLNVLYMGSRYDDFQNRTGALYLLKTLIPALNTAYPGELHFHLTGKFAHDHLGAAAQGLPNVTLHDYVPDLNALIQTTDIFCLPVRLGWGCKLKMLEGLAYGLPVVGAWQAFRGVPHEPGLFASCDTVADYVQAFGLLRDPDARRRMGEQARTAYQRWCETAKDDLFRALVAVNPHVKRKETY